MHHYLKVKFDLIEQHGTPLPSRGFLLAPVGWVEHIEIQLHDALHYTPSL